MVSEGGYTLDLLDAAALPAGPATPGRVPRSSAPTARPSPATTSSHDEDLHLIAVRRDLAGFQHVHPELGADGVWRGAARR